MHDSRNIVEFVAMNSSIALNQLSVVIDEKLVNFSKWHCFKVFEKNKWLFVRKHLSKT